MKKISRNNSTKKILIIILALMISSFMGYRFALAQGGNALKSVVELGSMTTEASYIIFTDGTYVYARNGTTGEIEFSGTNASYVIQKCIDALPTSNGGIIYVKEGTYSIDTPITITKENVHIEGVGKGSRTSGTSLTTSTLDNQQFFFTWTANTTYLWGGGLSNIQLYNTNITHQVGGVKLYGSNYSIEQMMFREIYGNYLWQPILLDGFIWWNTFRDCSFEGYNAAFNGHSIIRMEKSNLQSNFWNAPKYNIFEGFLTNIQGTWVSGIYVNHSRANYNIFRDIRFLSMNLSNSLVYDAGASNFYDTITGQDLVLQDASAFKGMIVVELREFPYDVGYGPDPGESAHGGFGDTFKNMFLSYNPRILLLNGSFQNDFEIKIWGDYTVKINATDGGTDNRVKIEYSTSSHYEQKLKYEIYGDILIEGPDLVNSGNATVSNNDWIAHGLADMPSVVTITPRSNATVWVNNRNATHFQVGVSSGMVTVDWHAEV